MNRNQRRSAQARFHGQMPKGKAATTIEQVMDTACMVVRKALHDEFDVTLIVSEKVPAGEDRKPAFNYQSTAERGAMAGLLDDVALPLPVEDLTPAAALLLFEGQVDIATFSAFANRHKDDGLPITHGSLSVYPLKDGGGFLWCIWVGGRPVDDNTIVAGGKVNAPFRQKAVEYAVGRFLAWDTADQVAP